MIDYAAECGEQGFIDTAPFKSHLRVAFIFHISFGTICKTFLPLNISTSTASGLFSK
jgi:hypothetical protein